MLKPWQTLWAAVAAVVLLLPCSSAQEAANGILFLELRRDAAGITLRRADLRPGHLKPQTQNGALEFEVSQPDGPATHTGRLEDPLFERIEFPDAIEPGALQTQIITRDAAEFTLRLPANAAGQRLRFFRRATVENGRLRMLAAREPLGEIAIPEPAARLQAFTTSARRYTLLTNGPTSARLNIAILAEGFTDAEESGFTNRAQNVLDQFLATSPYKEYRNHFNGFAIFVPSAESGSDHPTTGISRNTYFNSSYGEGSLVRLITIPPNRWNSNYSDGAGKVSALLAQYLPEYDIALLLVNDTEYGGSGGFPAIASINASSAELALHEIGHSFADLGDEYDTPAPGYPDIEKANTTKETRREFIKWRNWIDPLTPIPTPETALYANLVGLFEGAYFHETDWFRPKLDCRMKTLDREFCEVCQEAIVLSAYSRLEIIQSSSPPENNIAVPGGGEVPLQVSAPEPVQTPLVYTWTIDGVTNEFYSGQSFPASFATLGIGTRLVRVSVSDPTPLVRTDPTGKLWKTRSWLVQVASETNQPPVIGPIADMQLPASDATVTVPFSISDPDSPITNLTITAVTSNTNLFSQDDLRVSGSGTSRSLAITTHCGRSGTSVITISATDGDNVVSTDLIVTVIPLEAHISISPIADQRTFARLISTPLLVINEGCGEPTLIASSSNTNLLPDANIAIEGSGTNWLLRLAAAADESGSAVVTLRAWNDEGALTTTSFTVTFLPPPIAIAAAPEKTPDGLVLRFSCEPASAMVLEHSTDFQTWRAVISSPSAATLEHLVPTALLESRGFFRLRLLPL